MTSKVHRRTASERSRSRARRPMHKSVIPSHIYAAMFAIRSGRRDEASRHCDVALGEPTRAFLHHATIEFALVLQELGRADEIRDELAAYPVRTLWHDAARAIVDSQLPLVRVDCRGRTERDRRQVFAVAERQIEEHRDAQWFEVLLQHVFERLATQPRVALLRRIRLRELADRDARDTLELPGVAQLREHAVEVPRRAVDVLEEEDGVVEVDLP